MKFCSFGLLIGISPFKLTKNLENTLSNNLSPFFQLLTNEAPPQVPMFLGGSCQFSLWVKKERIAYKFEYISELKNYCFLMDHYSFALFEPLDEFSLHFYRRVYSFSSILRFEKFVVVEILTSRDEQFRNR